MGAFFPGMRFPKTVLYFNSLRQESFVDTKANE